MRELASILDAGFGFSMFPDLFSCAVSRLEKAVVDWVAFALLLADDHND
jgi:hypothetical protein